MLCPVAQGWMNGDDRENISSVVVVIVLQA